MFDRPPPQRLRQWRHVGDDAYEFCWQRFYCDTCISAQSFGQALFRSASARPSRSLIDLCGMDRSLGLRGSCPHPFHHSSTLLPAALPALPSLPPSSSRADRPGARAPAPSPPPDRRAGAARPERQPEEGRAWRLRGARDGESPTAATGLRLRASQETAGGRALDARHAGASRAAGAIEGGRAASAARRAAELRRVEGVRGSMIL
ncbi:unnamed protein product, partial [Prorocentrum cordatum]